MRPLCMYTGDAEAPIYQWLVEQGVEVIQVRLNLASLHALPARPRAQEWCVRGALTAARPPGTQARRWAPGRWMESAIYRRNSRRPGCLVCEACCGSLRRGRLARRQPPQLHCRATMRQSPARWRSASRRRCGSALSPKGTLMRRLDWPRQLSAQCCYSRGQFRRKAPSRSGSPASWRQRPSPQIASAVRRRKPIVS